MPDAIYNSENCRIAWQLRWSLTSFTNVRLPDSDQWREQLGEAIDPDGVRVLELQVADGAAQFLLSTRPEVCPAAVIRSVKGRLQYLLRDTIPKLWRRHYSITSVGDANNETLQGYVARQVQRHPMADVRGEERLNEVQFHDTRVNLETARASAHGRFIHNLHIVIENADHLLDTREELLRATRQMAESVCTKKGWLLSRLGIVGNHLHVLVGCGVDDVPRDVALSLMNNLAYAQGMKRVYENSFYLGSFGPYDQQAIRRAIADQ